MTRPLIQGFGYGATRTREAAGMQRFFAALGVAPSVVDGASATMYRFADGSFFGVAEPDEDERPAGVTSAEVAAPDPGPDGFVDDGRIVGFRVASLDEALAALEAAGFPAIDGHENEWSRYAHVAGPDGRLYEFVELLDR